uniref:Protein kinase domain-containing protein n=1 Tax=Quercus lobata TaxID=97700 RepID=A0A7N2MFA0_QUELO
MVLNAVDFLMDSWSWGSDSCREREQENLEGPSCGNRELADRVYYYLEEIFLAERNIPSSLSNCSNLRFINLHLNKLKGKIPAELGFLLKLEVLQVSRNNLTGGSIPSSIASLKGLRYLDVSRNNLSGLIPKGLEKLQFLGNLNLLFNDIEGELPACPIKVKKSRNSLAFKLIIATVFFDLLFLLLSFFLVRYWRKKPKKNSSYMASTIDLLPNASYGMLEQATNGFSPSNLIGSSSFGSIYKGVLHPEETLIAVKVLNLKHKGASKSVMAECNVLRNIRHRNLVKILTCCSSMDYGGNQFKALVFEFMTNGSLDIWLHPEIDGEDQMRDLSLLQRLNVAIDVASALNYLHNHFVPPIIHCDLKPSIILLDNDMFAHIVEPILLQREVKEMPTTTVVAREDNNKNEIEVDEETHGVVNQCQMDANVHKCLVLVLEIGLACSTESPKERMDMEEVTRELHLIKNTFLGSRIRRGRLS